MAAWRSRAQRLLQALGLQTCAVNICGARPAPASVAAAAAASGASLASAPQAACGPSDGSRLVRFSVREKQDMPRLMELLGEAMEDQGLDFSSWKPVGRPAFADANGPVQGSPDLNQLAYPLTVDVKLMEVKEEEAADSDASRDGTDSQTGGSTNPYDTGKYSAPVMNDDELQSVTLPFSAIHQRLRETLEKHGTAIVVGVIPDEELGALESEFKEDLLDLIDQEELQAAGEAAGTAREALARVRAEGPRAFPVKQMAKLTAAAGFSVRNCLSHGRFAWRVRQHPRVKEVYQAIYPEASGLVSSMDVTFFTPEGQPATQANSFSAHVDQNKMDIRDGLNEWESYQGVLYVWPSTRDGNCSTTVLWPGSHRSVWPKMMEDEAFLMSGEMGFHYSEIKEMQDAALARHLAEGWARHARRAVVPKGGLLLWNSRTVHTGWRGGPRLAQTVCFEPEERRPAAERLSKIRLAALGLPSTHWASVGMQHDIVLGDAGYSAILSKANGKKRKWDPRGKALPLRKAIRPAALTEGADVAALAELAQVEYSLTGMWEPPEGVEKLLEASVKEEFKSLL